MDRFGESIDSRLLLLLLPLLPPFTLSTVPGDTIDTLLSLEEEEEDGGVVVVVRRGEEECHDERNFSIDDDLVQVGISIDRCPPPPPRRRPDDDDTVGVIVTDDF